MFLANLIILFYIFIILANIISTLRFSTLEGMECNADPLIQTKLNQADILKIEKQINEWNVEQINKDITSLNLKCNEAIKAKEEMDAMREDLD